MGACRVGICKGSPKETQIHNYPCGNENFAILVQNICSKYYCHQKQKENPYVWMHFMFFQKKAFCKLVTSTIWSVWQRGWWTEVCRHGFTAALIQGCPKPVVESCNLARFCVLQAVSYSFYWDSTCLGESFWLPGTTENLAGWSLRTGFGNPWSNDPQITLTNRNRRSIDRMGFVIL